MTLGTGAGHNNLTQRKLTSEHHPTSMLTTEVTKMRLPILTVLCLFVMSSAIPIGKDKNAMFYLQKFGYLEESTGYVGASITEESVVRALKGFQRFAGLKQTGELDSDTVTTMDKPRCGVKDILGLTRKKRYAHQGSRWTIKRLTYRISKYPTRFLSRQLKVDEEIARAFKVWSDVTDLKIEQRKRGRVQIDVRFEEGEHGDDDPFDGPNKTVAHGIFPQFGGDAHFDDEEEWSFDAPEGINMFQVAVHVFGHSLGLAHSDVKGSVMSPYYSRSYQPSFNLSEDDVTGIQAIYGTGAHNSSTLEPQAGGSPPDAPDICQDAVIDTVTRTQNGTTYIFKGDFYWEVLSVNIAEDYPRRISEDWDDLVGNLDASLTWSNGKTFFFKGEKYWRFTNKRMDPGYPKLIRVGFEGIPDAVDAALVWSGNGKTYFFKDDQYWQYDSHRDPPVSRKYPRPISNWVGLPNSIDAAFQWKNSRTYFFKGDEFYRFNDVSFAVDTADPPYPRQTFTWWFRCQNRSYRIP